MAGELNVTIGIAYAKGANVVTKADTHLVDISLTALTSAVISIGITDESVVLGDVANPGYVVFHNIDPTNFIQISDVAITTTSPIKLKPDEWCVTRWGNTAIHAKASTAPCDLEYVLFPD